MKSQLIFLGALLATNVGAHPAPRSNGNTLQYAKRLAVDLNPFRFKLGSKYTPSASVDKTVADSSADYVQSATALVTKLFPGSQFRLVDDHYTSSNGISHVNFKQTVLGFDLDNADFNVNVAEDGTIFSYGNSFFSGLLPTADPLSLSNLITPLSALTGVTRTLGLALSADSATAVANGSPGSFTFQGVSGTVSAPTARLVYFQTPAGLVLPAWRVETDLDHDWLVTYINALGTGDILGVVNYVADATYTVFKWPLDNPTEGVRTKEANPEYRKASEFGWQGDGKATYMTTIGNNGFAQGNTDGDDEYLDEARPFSSNQVYDYPYDVNAADPKTYLNASVTQLFYTSNMYHDLLWKLGFTEAAGNFETNNNGAGGKGNDAVILNTQDGSGTNNANFATPPDGEPGRMRMYIFDITNPPRDGSFEAGIVIHEYTHGLSNRLTGGPANSNCLVLPESGGMGEGWSDFFATAIRVKGTDTRTKDYAIGDWAFNDPKGIRQYVYSTSLTTNPFKYSSLNGKTEVHAIGAVWATFLYEMLWNLIDKRGNTAANSPTLGAKGAPTDGRYLAMKLALDGMALQPCNPTFVQARDAILDADKALTGGKNLCAIWSAFAKRGLGSDATDLLAVKTDGYKIPAGVC